MNAIYFMSETQHLLFTFLTCLLLITQAYIFHLACDVNRPNRKLVLSQEIIILCFVLAATLAMSTPIISLQHGDLALDKYDLLRYVIGFLALSTAFWGTQTKLTGLLLVVTALMSFPWADNYVLCFFTSLLLWAIRDYFVFKRIQYLRQEQITPGAIKEAMDYLPIGMIFARENGEIFLSNIAGLKYMYGCFQHYFGDISHLWNASVDFPDNKCLSKSILGKDLLLRLTPDCSLLLSLTVLPTPKNKIQQLLIKNVTEEDHDTMQLGKQNAALAASGANLKTMLRNLEAVTRQQVATQLRFYMHDLMGQRLTILQQLLYEGTELDYDKFLAVLDEVSGDMRKSTIQTPENKLANILSTYQNIGINVLVNGTLPTDRTMAKTFVAIIREGITNAIRHGHCDTVNIQLSKEKEKFILTIADNGISCSKFPVFGTGLTGIANRLREINGILSIQEHPAFTIRCEVEENHD